MRYDDKNGHGVKARLGPQDPKPREPGTQDLASSQNLKVGLGTPL